MIGAAEAQVQTDPAPIKALPIPAEMPVLPFSGLNPDDASVISETIRGSVQDMSPEAVLALQPVGSTTALEQMVTPAVVAVEPATTGAAAVGDPTPLVPDADAAPDVPTETPPAEAAVPEKEPEPEAPSATAVTVIVEGIQSASGSINVALCNTGLSREGCPYSKEIKAAAGFVEAHFTDIPPGRYAVVGYHDENGNDKHDRFLGVPKEPFALSAAAGSKMIPTFDDAAVKIKEGDNTFIIKMRTALGS